MLTDSVHCLHTATKSKSKYCTPANCCGLSRSLPVSQKRRKMHKDMYNVVLLLFWLILVMISEWDFLWWNQCSSSFRFLSVLGVSTGDACRQNWQSSRFQFFFAGISRKYIYWASCFRTSLTAHTFFPAITLYSILKCNGKLEGYGNNFPELIKQVQTAYSWQKLHYQMTIVQAWQNNWNQFCWKSTAQ